MKACFFTVSCCWVLLNVLQALSIPLEEGTPSQAEQEAPSVACHEKEYQPRGKNYCCNKCHPGFRLEAECSEGNRSHCLPCDEGNFLASSNFSPSCEACNECLLQNGQIEVAPCRKESDVQCGCPAGQYKSGKYPGDPHFVCKQCGSCQNGTIIRQCHDNEDTVCRCRREFFFDESERRCRHCIECDSPDCKDDCPQIASSIKHQEDNKVVWIAVAVAATVVLVGVAVCLVQYYRTKVLSPPSSPDLTGNIKSSDPLMNNNNKPEHRHLLPGYTVCESSDSHLMATAAERGQKRDLPLPDITRRTPRHQCPKVLYAIIECVPVRHWREFARRLGLSDHIIDTSEQDHRYFRDAQHRMLQAWTCLEGSSLDQLYRVLREMNLGGCVEKIEERIEAGPGEGPV